MSERQLNLFQGPPERIDDGRPPVSDERPETLPSRTYKLKLPFETDILTLYLTITDLDGRPYEFFLNCSHAQITEYLTAVSVLGSRMLRNGFPVELVAEDLNTIASPFTGHLRRGGYCPSLSALIARTLLAHVHGHLPP